MRRLSAVNVVMWLLHVIPGRHGSGGCPRRGYVGRRLIGSLHVVGTAHNATPLTNGENDLRWRRRTNGRTDRRAALVVVLLLPLVAVSCLSAKTGCTGKCTTTTRRCLPWRWCSGTCSRGGLGTQPHGSATYCHFVNSHQTLLLLLGSDVNFVRNRHNDHFYFFFFRGGGGQRWSDGGHWWCVHSHYVSLVISRHHWSWRRRRLLAPNHLQEVIGLQNDFIRYIFQWCKRKWTHINTTSSIPRECKNLLKMYNNHFSSAHSPTMWGYYTTGGRKRTFTLLWRGSSWCCCALPSATTARATTTRKKRSRVKKSLVGSLVRID